MALDAASTATGLRPEAETVVVRRPSEVLPRRWTALRIALPAASSPEVDLPPASCFWTVGWTDGPDDGAVVFEAIRQAATRLALIHECPYR